VGIAEGAGVLNENPVLDVHETENGYVHGENLDVGACGDLSGGVGAHDREGHHNAWEASVAKVVIDGKSHALQNFAAKKETLDGQVVLYRDPWVLRRFAWVGHRDLEQLEHLGVPDQTRGKSRWRQKAGRGSPVHDVGLALRENFVGREVYQAQGELEGGCCGPAFLATEERPINVRIGR
jgi:hypothetical protein